MSIQSQQKASQQSRVCDIQTFSILQKVWVRILLYGFFAIGMLGVLMEDRFYGLFYLMVMGLAGFIVLQCFCSHCPYPYTAKTCLGMPYRMVIHFRFKDRSLTIIEKILFIASLIFAMGFPQYFLIQRIPLFILYWLFCLPTCIVFPAYFCRKCRFSNCPFNPHNFHGCPHEGQKD